MVAPKFPRRIGGMQSHAGETSLRLASRGHTLLVLTASENRSLSLNFPFVVQPVLGRSPSAAHARIQTAAKGFTPDVVLLMNSGFAPAVAHLRSFLPPVVVRTAGNDAYGAWYGPRHPFRFLFWHLPHERPGSIGARFREIDQNRRVAMVLSSLATAIVSSVIAYTLARLRTLAPGLPGDLLTLLTGGVDTDLFQPADLTQFPALPVTE